MFDEYGPVHMIRDHDYKYVHRYPYGPHELYDLKNDPDETVNLINKRAHRETAISMKARLDMWFDRYVDPSLDGAHEPVTGADQFGLTEPGGKGNSIFGKNKYFQDEFTKSEPVILVTPW